MSPERGYTGKPPYVWLSLMALFMVLASSIPHFVAYYYSPPGTEYGGTLLGHDNVTSYYSFIKQYADGRILADNRLTPEVHGGAYFNLQWFLVGKLGHLLGGGFNTTFQAWRVTSIILAVFSWYLLTGHFTDSKGLRLMSAFALFGGGGFGWIFAILDKLGVYRQVFTWNQPFAFSKDITGLNFMYVMENYPHSCFSLAIVCIGLYFAIKGIKTGGKLQFALAGVSCAVAMLSRPYDGVILSAAIFFYAVVDYIRYRRPAKEYLGFSFPLLFGACAVLYNYAVLHGSPAFRDWGHQAVVMPLLPFNLLVYFGLWSFLLLYSIRLSHTCLKDPATKLALTSFIVTLSLYYIFPLIVFSAQFGMLLIPFAALFCLGCVAPRLDLRKLKANKPMLAAVSVFMLVHTIDPAYSIYKQAGRALSGEYSLDAETAESYKWMRQNSNEEETVLSALRTSIFLFRFSNNRVFLGHHSQTIDVDGKKKELAEFFDKATPDSFRQDLLSRYNIKYVFYGPEERNIGAYDPFTSAFLTPIFRNGKVAIFRVTG